MKANRLKKPDLITPTVLPEALTSLGDTLVFLQMANGGGLEGKMT